MVYMWTEHLLRVIISAIKSLVNEWIRNIWERTSCNVLGVRHTTRFSYGVCRHVQVQSYAFPIQAWLKLKKVQLIWVIQFLKDTL